MNAEGKIKIKIHSKDYQKLIIFRSLTDRCLVFSADVHKVNRAFYFKKIQLLKQVSSESCSKPVKLDVVEKEQSHGGRNIKGLIVISHSNEKVCLQEFIGNDVTEYSAIVVLNEYGPVGRLVVTDLKTEISDVPVEMYYDLDKDLEEDCLRQLESQVVEI